jgi:hypothetical protein
MIKHLDHAHKTALALALTLSCWPLPAPTSTPAHADRGNARYERDRSCRSWQSAERHSGLRG